jgi:hypothetical protein
MKFPKYWKTVKNSSGLVVARGWSNLSEHEAAQRADARLQRILNWLRSADAEDLDRYSYVIDDAICEPVIDRITDPNDQEIAVISRNAYGALVLNVPWVMIVDIDIDSKIKRPGIFARLLGAKAPAVNFVLQEKLGHLKHWQEQNPQFALRVYRTAAGLRVIFTNQLFQQIDANVISIMDQLQSDPLYRELCISQKCFRARLSPKPWRIGLLSPTHKFPFSADEQERAIEKWFSGYVRAANNWAVCEFIDSLGTAAPHPIAWRIVEVHDSFCCRAGMKLA